MRLLNKLTGNWFKWRSRGKTYIAKETKKRRKDSCAPQSEGDFDLTLAERDEEILKSLGPNISPKIIHFFGDDRLVPRKAQRLYGTLDFPAEKVRAQRKAEIMEQAKQAILRAKAIEEVMRMKPTPEQLALPQKDRLVSMKALRLLGDEGLNQQACRVLTPSMRKNVSPKTLSVFGEMELLTPKQLQVFGDSMYVPNYPHYHSSSVDCFGYARDSLSCHSFGYSPQLVTA